MSRYFKETSDQKIMLSHYLKECSDIAAQNMYFVTQKQKCKQIEYIMSILGDEEMPKDVMDAICDSFNSSLCRYGSECMMPYTVRELYQISKIFPELSKEALVAISREYIKDLFDEHDLIKVLAMLLRTDGINDETFEKFMTYVQEKAKKAESKYKDEAWSFEMAYGSECSYNFVTHFKTFMIQHHIPFSKISTSLPEYELIRADERHLSQIMRKAKDCWGVCDPISYQLLEDYLTDEDAFAKTGETFSYTLSAYAKSEPATFTKSDFIESIQRKNGLSDQGLRK